MKKLLSILGFIFLFSNIFAQYNKDIGINYTNTYLLRFTKFGTNTGGYGLSFSIGKPNNSLRLTTQFVRLNTFSITPAWENVKAYSIESNIELLAHLENSKTVIYPFAGISYQHISGKFTGIQDYSGLRYNYITNSRVITLGPAINLGVGIEQPFKKIKLCAHYRMHVGRSENRIMITDICVDAGVKYNLDIQSEHKKSNDTKEKKHLFRNPLFPKGKYGWW